MDDSQTSYRVDQQLAAILYDSANWAVIGQTGKPICFARSLRLALDRATELAAAGEVPVALSRHPFDNIIVLAKQIDRLRKIVAGLEVAPLKLTNIWDDGGDVAEERPDAVIPEPELQVQPLSV